MRLPTLIARALALALLASGPDLSLADAVAAPAPAGLRVEVAVVRASHGAPYIDPSLSAFTADLRSMPYERFERVNSASVPTTVGTRQEISLSDTLRAIVTVDSIDETGAAATVVILRSGETVTHTTVRRPWGRAQVIGVSRTAEDALVVPIAVVR